VLPGGRRTTDDMWHDQEGERSYGQQTAGSGVVDDHCPGDHVSRRVGPRTDINPVEKGDSTAKTLWSLTAPRTPEGKPEFQGMWSNFNATIAQGVWRGGTLVLV
jgi:hypothetical protein